MRLNERQRLGILDALQETFPDVQGKLKLYGSRAQDELKGGDIDLCLIVETNQEAEDLQTKIIPFLIPGFLAETWILELFNSGDPND